MTTETITALKFQCSCGYETENRKEFQGHLMTMGRKEKGVHKSVEVRNENVSTAQAQPETTPQVETGTAGIANAGVLEWRPKQPTARQPKKHTLTACIVIDSHLYWHENVMLDLTGIDTSANTWGYYGKRMSVFIESGGELKPYIPQDIAGGSVHKLFIAAKASGYKAYMKIDNDLMHKLQVGMMALLVIGILFLIYILINQKPPGAESSDAISSLVLLMGVI